jgi:hypothetical protein
MKDRIEFYPLRPGDKGKPVDELYEGKIHTWYKKLKYLKDLKDKESQIREAMSWAIKLGRAEGFEIGDTVAHPSFDKFLEITSIDEHKRFAQVSDTENEYEVNYSELFNPNVFKELLRRKFE